MYGTFAQRMECYNYPSLLFLILTYILLRHNYLIYFFDVVTFFYDVRITLYFGTFELCMEIMLQLRFAFVRHCEVTLLRQDYNFCYVTFTLFICLMQLRFLMTLELRYNFGTFKLSTETTL